MLIFQKHLDWYQIKKMEKPDAGTVMNVKSIFKSFTVDKVQHTEEIS